MANNFDYAVIYQDGIDKQLIQEATTGWMESNAGQVKYNGGAEVKIPSIAMDGLGDYDRANGFTSGDVTLTYQTHTMTQDRGRSFSIDAMDIDETNFQATSGNLIGEFQRTKVVPEIDAYRYSKLATLAVDAGQSKELAVEDGNIVDELLADLTKMEDEVGVKDVVITMSPIMASKLAKNGKEFMSKMSLSKLDMSIEVQAFNENAIIRASSKVLKSEIEIKTDGVGGFEAGAGAKDINWLITTKDAPIAISKTDKVRVFAPDVNQDADAFKIDFRKYHDLWVVESKLPCIYVNLNPGA